MKEGTRVPRSITATDHTPSQGIIVCRLDEVMLRAEQRWGVRLSASRIARATRMLDKATGKMAGVNVKTIRKLVRNESTLYDLHTLAMLCWYFGCQVEDLLEYVAPARQRSPVPVDAIKRLAPPDGPPPVGLTLTSHIATVIAEKRESPATIAHLTHLKWDTVTGHTREAHRSRIGQQTLVDLCTVLGVSAGTLFTC